MLIVGIDGSPPRGRVVRRLLREALQDAIAEGCYHGKHIKTTTVYLSQLRMQHHDGTWNTPDWIKPLFDLVLQADGIVFATPVNAYGPSDRMITLLNYLYSLEHDDTSHQLGGKLFGAIAHGHIDGGMSTAAHFAKVVSQMGMHLAANGLFFQTKHAKKKSEGLWQLTDHRLVTQNMVRLMIALKACPIDNREWRLRQFDATKTAHAAA